MGLLRPARQFGARVRVEARASSPGVTIDRLRIDELVWQQVHDGA